MNSEKVSMRITQFLEDRTPLIIAPILFAAGPTRAQEKSTQMVPGHSVKELVPKSSKPDQDGVSQIIFALLFKPGAARSARALGACGSRATHRFSFSQANVGLFFLIELILQDPTVSLVFQIQMMIAN